MAQDHLTKLIAEHLGANDPPEAAALAASIRGAFDVREKATAPSTAAPLAVGQTWRNRQSDRLVRITELPGTVRANPHTGTTYSDGRVHWEAVTGRGARSGAVWALNWDRRFDYVEG